MLGLFLTILISPHKLKPCFHIPHSFTWMSHSWIGPDRDPAPVTWKQYNPGPAPALVFGTHRPPIPARILAPGPVDWKKLEPRIRKNVKRKSYLTARSKESEGTSIESFHYIISQLSQKVEVLIKQGLLHFSVYGNFFHSHQRTDKQAWEWEHKKRNVCSSGCMCDKNVSF